MPENDHHMESPSSRVKKELQEKHATALAFAYDVDRTATLIDARLTLPSDVTSYLSIDESAKYMAMQTEVLQLKALAEYSLDMACGIDKAPIDIDNSLITERTNTLSELDFYNAYKDVITEAQEIGIVAGTKDFLSLLAPEEITDEVARELYFSPWNKAVTSRRGHLIERADGSAWLSLPTRLPNVHLSYIYSPDRKRPIRELYRHVSHEAYDVE